MDVMTQELVKMLKQLIAEGYSYNDAMTEAQYNIRAQEMLLQPSRSC